MLKLSSLLVASIFLAYVLYQFFNSLLYRSIIFWTSFSTAIGLFSNSIKSEISISLLNGFYSTSFFAARLALVLGVRGSSLPFPLATGL
jgi:hypothetical protein